MSDARRPGVVVDTMVVSWLFGDRPDRLTLAYRDLIGGAPVVLAFQTVMELRYGALRASWGELRRLRLERWLADLAVAQPDDELITICAALRGGCQQLGHALAGKVHDGDRWMPPPRSASDSRSCPTTEAFTVRRDSSSSPSRNRSDERTAGSHPKLCPEPRPETSRTG